MIQLGLQVLRVHSFQAESFAGDHLKEPLAKLDKGDNGRVSWVPREAP
jgi:hypothetical protein